MDKTRWAVVGTGYIAGEFASGMKEVTDAELTAVVSRREETGRRFAERFHCGSIYTDLKEMLDAERPDIVYIAIPNDCHYSYIMKALEAGVPVLSEKPMVDNRRQFEAVKSLAGERKIFLMEGMWTRCFPAVLKARKWIREGRIGKPLTVRCGFDIRPDRDHWQTWKNGIRHAGGALRDVGIYGLAMADMVFPWKPEAVYTTMRFNGEVDENFHMMMDYGEGRTAFVSGAFDQISEPKTEISGEQGRILIGPEFWHPDTATLISNQGEEVYRETYQASGFQYEIRAVQEAVRGGQRECPYYTLEETERIADIIEDTRKRWGIIYQSDREEER